MNTKELIDQATSLQTAIEAGEDEADHRLAMELDYTIQQLRKEHIYVSFPKKA